MKSRLLCLVILGLYLLVFGYLALLAAKSRRRQKREKERSDRHADRKNKAAGFHRNV